MQPKFMWLLAFILLTGNILAQNAAISGFVKDADSNQFIEGVTVEVLNNSSKSTTDASGFFTLDVDGVKNVQISFTKEGFRSLTIHSSVTNEGNTDLGTIFLVNLSTANQDVPTITITDSDSETALESQTIHGLLSSSRDVFVSAAAYTFGPARFRMRGYDNDLQTVMINGFIMNEAETGRPIWSNWGGLNDVMRNTVITTDASPTGAMYEPLGGLTQVITNASEYRPGVKLVYSSSNRSYRNRLMATGSTGLMDNNWAITASISTRWSEEGYKEATFYDAQSFFFSAEKIFNQKHRINFTALTASFERGVGGGAMQEVYNLVGDNYYNPYWGYQNGEKRNARVRSGNKPLFTLQHTWTPTASTKVKTTAGYWFGKGGYTSLNWQDAKDPRPDYYRNLPSYPTTSAEKERLADMWRNDPKVRQIDWDKLYLANQSGGNEVSGIDGKRALYVVEDRRNDISQFQFNSNIEHAFNDNWKINAGVNVDLYTGDVYNVVDDLLGAAYWLDVDQFAERDFPDNPDAIQNDLNNPNRIVREGDIYSHHYKPHINTYNVWLMAHQTGEKYTVYVGGNFKYNEFWREGLMRKGLFPDNSFGDSEKQQFYTYGVKAGGEYRFTGRHIVKANASYGTQPPLFRNAYVSPRTRDDIVNNLKKEVIMSVDAGYFFTSPNFTMRLSGYYTRINDEVKNTNFYHEDLRTFVNYTMSGIDKQYMGFELGGEYKISPTWTVNTAIAMGDYTYESNPDVIITRDNNRKVEETNQVRSKGFKIAGTPQNAYTVGIKYNSPKYWWAGVSASYFDKIYMDFNPVTRTADSKLPSNPYWRWSLQEKLDAAYTIDAFAGKSWRINGYYISLSANINNVTNNQSFITGGYEQLRYNADRPELFAPKYYYFYGLNYFANLSVSF
nr:carboxypeptidase regulatory-like domain-containing protein [uncultured Carboxylicivirga sp.]